MGVLKIKYLEIGDPGKNKPPAKRLFLRNPSKNGAQLRIWKIR